MVKPLPVREFSLVFPRIVPQTAPFLKIYISSLSDGIQSIYVDDTSYVSKYQDFKKSEHELNKNFTIIKNYAFQCIKVCFFRKVISSNPKPLSFNQSRFNSRY